MRGPWRACAPRGHPPWGRQPAAAVAALAVLALVLAACGTGNGDPRTQPRDGRAGVQLSGTLDGRQVAVRDGAPQLVTGDCDPRTGPDDDVCVITQTISGDTFVLVFENPALFEEGVELDVADSDCRGARCDDITDHAVVDVQVGEDRVRARAGEVRVQHVEPAVRYRAEVRLELPGGRLSGHLDVVPRDD